MKTNQTKIHLLLATLGTCLALATPASAGEKSDGTRGGGQVVREGQKLSLKDFKESTICEWEPASNWLATLLKNPYMPQVLKSIKATNWLFANQYERAANAVSICWTGKLRTIDTNDTDAITTTKIRGEQVAIFIFDTNEIFIDRALAKEATRSDPTFETYLFFHEMAHKLIPSDMTLRNTKLGSLVYALRLHTKKPMSRELFDFQITQARAGTPDYTEEFAEPMRTDCRLGLSAQPNDQSIQAAHRCYQMPHAERIFGKDYAYLKDMETRFNGLGVFTERRDRNTLTDEKALDIAKNLVEQGYGNFLYLISEAIDANYPETTRYLFSIIDSETETKSSDYLLRKVLKKKDPTFLNAYLANPRLAKNITTTVNLWEEVFDLNIASEVFQTLWQNHLLNPNAFSTRPCNYDLELFRRRVVVQGFPILRVYKTTRCLNSREKMNSEQLDIQKITDPVLNMAIRLNRLDIVQTLLSAPKIDLDANSIADNGLTIGTPLFVAINQQNNEALKLLLQHPRINPNSLGLYDSLFVGTHYLAPTDLRPTIVTALKGVTPLMLSVYYGDIQATELLLAHPNTSTKASAHTQEHLRCTSDRIPNMLQCPLDRYFPRPIFVATALEIAGWNETKYGPELAQMILDVRNRENR